MEQDQAQRGIGLNEVVYTATAAIDDNDEAVYEVRYTGRSGDGTLHFLVRRRVRSIDKPQRASTYSPYVSAVPRGPIPREWECVVPVSDHGRATARWWFGDEPELCRVDHYIVGEDNDLFFADPADMKPKGRIGFRQGDMPE